MSDTTAATTNAAVRCTKEILTPGNDDRQYRHITLGKNSLQVLLVSDPTTEKSAACCDVQVGSMADPAEAQGLAHFLEHMLFMGTEKYPEENQYSAFLSTHGGYSNAYTDQESTVYYFDVNKAHLENALDLFSSFFTCPLFTEASTMREINAVDSENSKNLQSDMWRKFQLFKSMARPDHPLHSFSTGNLETLGKIPESKGTNIRDLMIEFYKKHYSANLMRLSIYGSESLDQLEAWAVEKFSDIPNKEIPRQVYPTDPFSASQVKRLVEVVPVKDLKTVDLCFPIPATKMHYLKKPVKYFAHLIGHESDGSILSALKKKLWANGLSSYAYLTNNDFGCFVVTIELSDEGVKHIQEIIACVFTYIGMILRQGPQDWVWEEMRDIAAMTFRYKDKSDPADYAVDLATHLQIYAPEHVISGDTLLFEKDLDLSMQYLKYLTPANCLVFVVHKGLEGKTALKEKYYGTDHNVRDFTQEELAMWEATLEGKSEWNDVLHLPQANPFIPTDFSLREVSEEKKATLAKMPMLVARDFSTSEVSEEAVSPTAETPVAADSAKAEGEDEEEDDEEEEEGEEEADGAAWTPSFNGKASLVWHKQDQTWQVPKLNVFLSLESHYATCTAWNVIMTDLLKDCLKEVLSEFSYYADCAGLFYDLQLSKGGIEMFFQGFGHKLPVLVEQTIQELYRVAHEEHDELVSEDLFRRVKEKQLRALKNLRFSQPYYHCVLGNLMCLEDPRWSNSEKYVALQSATLSGFKIFAKQFLAQAKVELLVNGNAASEEASQLATKVRATLQSQPLPFSQEALRRAVAILPGHNALTKNGEKVVEYVYRQSAMAFNPNEVNSAIENLYLMGEAAGFFAGNTDPQALNVISEEEYHNRLGLEAMLELLVQILSEPAFDQLRTKEQLGYIVHTSMKRLAQNVLAVAFIVQSNSKDPLYLDSRVENFLQTYRNDIANMEASKLATYIDAVCEKLLEKPKNMDQETTKYWGEIRNNTYLFNRKELLVEKLKSSELTVAKVAAFFDQYLLAGSAKRCKFSSQFFGKSFNVAATVAAAAAESESTAADSKKQVVVIQDPSLFKRLLPLLPVQSYEV